MKLSPLIYKKIIETSLSEDIGSRGDITSDSIIPEKKQIKAVMRARANGVISGIDVAAEVFSICDKNINIRKISSDGENVIKGQDIMIVEGNARAILLAERTSLNIISHMSGISTETKKFVEEISKTKAKICCTRKTTPTLRALEKYAVHCGGGVNHRFGLDDAVLIKDNHIAIAGSIKSAIEAAKKNAGYMTKIEVEVDNLEQLKQVINYDIDVVMLDNMSPDLLRQAVNIVNGKIITEASGGVNFANIREIALTGVDLISIGWLTHSSPILDIGLDI